MNQHIHPAMRQALAPILPPGFRSAPAVATVDALHAQITELNQQVAELKEQYTPPPSKRGEHDGYYEHKKLGHLVVHYETDEGYAWVRAAFTGKVDLIDHLSSSELDDIAEAMDKLHAEQFEP